MSFIVTARKYRPQLFNEVVGQEHITTTLKNAILSGRIAHAYLLTGPRGVGKTTTARILAKSINCLNPKEAEPCNECEICLSIQNNQLLDIIEIDAASNRGIDDIRALRDSVRYAPAKGKYKVYIIDEVHMLTKDSFNAFLKTLEEPPPHTVFIFATTDVHRVPATILSRCQRYDFRRISLETTTNLLGAIAQKEGVEIDAKTLALIARKADGALRDAEGFFDQVVAFCGRQVNYETVTRLLSIIDDAVLFRISRAITEKKFSEAFEVSELLYESGWNFFDFLERLLEHFRNLLLVKLTGKTKGIEAAEIFKEQYLLEAPSFSESDLLRIMNFLTKQLNELKFSQNPKLRIEVALCHLIAFEKTENITNLIQRLNDPAVSVSTSFFPDTNPKISEKKKTELTNTDANAKSVPDVTRLQFSEAVKSSLPATSHGDATQKFVEEKTSKQTELDFSALWENLKTEITQEKKASLGGIVQHFFLEKIISGKVYIAVDDRDAMGVLELNKDYLCRKLSEKLGEKISVHLTLKSGKINTQENSLSVTTTTVITRQSPMEEAIIEILKGQRIA